MIFSDNPVYLFNTVKIKLYVSLKGPFTYLDNFMVN